MKKYLLVTEKYSPEDSQRDGGSFLVKDLTEALFGEVDVMQFSSSSLTTNDCKYNYVYPIADINRFTRRTKNASFIAEQVKKISSFYEKIIFVHNSLQFGITKKEIGTSQIITFPMFTGLCYNISGEFVPKDYLDYEIDAFRTSDLVFTPSYFEKDLLVRDYKVPTKNNCCSRGVNLTFFSGAPRAITASK